MSQFEQPPASLWAPLPAETDAPPLPGRRLLAEMLREVDKVLPGVLDAPDAVAAGLIREAVIDQLVASGHLGCARGSPAEVESALEILRGCLARHPACRPASGTVVVPTPGPPPLPDSLADMLAFRDRIEKRLVDVAAMAREPGLRAGILAYLLITRCGLCSHGLVAAAFLAAASNSGIRIHGSMLWIVVDADVDGQAQRRRVFLDPATVAAWSAVHTELAARLVEQERPAAIRRARALAREGLDQLWQAALGAPRAERWQQELMEAVAAEVGIETLPLLGSYARGTLVASSWEESCWLRNLGARQVDSTSDRAVASGREAESSRTRQAQCIDELVMGYPVDADPYQDRIRRMLAASDAGASRVRQALSALGDEFPEGSTRRYFAAWLSHLLQSRGRWRRSRLSTLRYYNSTFGSRLLASLPEQLDGLSAEELSDLFEELAETATSGQVERRLRNLIRRFVRFCQDNGLRVDGQVLVRGARGGHGSVSARHVTETHYAVALEALRAEGGANEPVSAAEVFLVLAYRLGLRRAEVLGLTLLDVHRANPECDVDIRPNHARQLKSPSARRKLPFSLLAPEEAERVRAFWEQRRAAAGRARCAGGSTRGMANPMSELSNTFLFLDGCATEVPDDAIADHPVPRKVLAALRRATGDPELHLHHLRHAFCTRLLVGALMEELPEAARALLPGFMLEMQQQARVFHERVRAFVGPRGRRAMMVALAAGHGSEHVTLRHYVHGLDVILHAVLASENRWQRSRRSVVDTCADLNSRESSLVSALLDKSLKSRATDGQAFAWLARQAARRGVNISCEPAASALPELTSTPDAVPTLDWAMAEKACARLPGFPSTPGHVASARIVIEELVAGMRREPIQARHALELLAGALAGDGWSRLRAPQVRELRACFRPAFASLRLEYRTSVDDSGKRKRARLAGRGLGRRLASDGARIEVRIANPTGRHGARSQRCPLSVAWAVRSVMAWYGLAPRTPDPSRRRLD